MTDINQLLKPYKGLQKGIYILAISRFVNALGALIFPFMTLILSEKIGLSELETGLYVSITGFLFIPSGLIGGKLADHFGRKKIILGFEFLGMMTYVYCYFAQVGMSMVYALMLAAVLFGIAGPAHDAIVADMADKDEREGAYSLMYLGFNLGFAVAIIMGGRLLANHLKLMFAIDVGTAMVALALVAAFIKEPRKAEAENQENAEKAGESKKEAAESGTIFQVLFKRPILVEYILLLFLYRFVYSNWSFMLPLHVADLFGDVKGFALYGDLGFVNAVQVVALTALITGLLRKVKTINKVVLAGLFFTIGFGMFGFIAAKWAFFVGVFLFTTGEIMEAISFLPYLMNHTPESHRGRMSSVAMTILSVGYSLSPIVFGWILTIADYRMAWIVTGGVALVGTIGMWRLSLKENKEETRKNLQLESGKVI